MSKHIGRNDDTVRFFDVLDVGVVMVVVNLVSVCGAEGRMRIWTLHDGAISLSPSRLLQRRTP